MYAPILLAAALTVSQNCFYNQEETKAMLYRLPKIESETLKKTFFNGRIRFYDRKTMPLAYQDFTPGALQGIHSPSYNISANRSEPYGNGNIEFPWGKPAGTHRTDGVTSVKFINMPVNDKQEVIPILYWRDSDNNYTWIYPHGTVIGEILFMEDVCFEIRTRTRNDSKWNVDVFRPYNNSKELKEQIIRSYPNYKNDTELTALMKASDVIDEDLMVLEDTQPNRRVFMSKIRRVLLPGISRDKATSLIASRPFKSSMGTTWLDKPDSPQVPTVTSGFGIVPAKYDGDFVEVSSKSCARCHDSTNVHVRNFDFGRDWYGHVRGSDGIFSFHIFDPSCISYNGIGNGVTISQGLFDAGFIDRKPEALDRRYYSYLSKQ